MSKIKQIAVTYDENIDYIFALTDDGRLYLKAITKSDVSKNEWEEISTPEDDEYSDE